MNFKELNKDNVNEVGDKELLGILFDSVMDMMEIDFLEQPDHELGRHIINPDFDDIRRKIRYEYDEKDGHTKFIMNIPVIDETKRDIYKRTVFTSNKFDIIPEKGHFVKAYAYLVIKPLGLVEVNFWGGKLKRMDKDYKNLPPVKDFSRTEYFWYDYEEKTYKQVDTDVFENVKFGLMKDKPLDLLLKDVDETTVVYIQEYLKREETLDAALKKINGYAEDLQEEYLDKFKDDKYDVKWQPIGDPKDIDSYEIKRSMSGAPINISEPTTDDILFYLARLAHRIKGALREWLKIKIVFSSITISEYEKLTAHLDSLLESVMDIGENISLLQKDIKSIDWKTKKDLMWDQEKAVEKVILQLDKLTITNVPRPFAFNKQMPLQGYIGYDLDRGILYPNLAELENRRYLKEEFSSIIEDEKYKESVLEILRKK